MAREYPLVSIALPVYNAENTLADSLRSILLQTYSNWELFIVDDGSTDSSMSIAKQFKDDRITIISDGRNFGISFRLNQAIDLAQGKYIARMDSDDIAYPDRLKIQVNFLKEHPDIDVVASQAIVFRDDGSAVGLLTTKITHEEICRHPLSGFRFPHPAWMGKREWFLKYHYNNMLRKSQDQDILLRSYLNSRFASMPEILLGYRQQRLSLRKILYSRFCFTGILLNRALKLRKVLNVCLCLAEQFCIGMIELFAISSGMGRVILRHRAMPAGQKKIDEWNTCWHNCHCDIK